MNSILENHRNCLSRTIILFISTFFNLFRMTFLNLSESSHAHDDKELVDSTPKAKTPQSTILENERLKELNSQLQNALASTKTQLKDALNTSACVNSMTDQINDLRQQISQVNSSKGAQQSQMFELTELTSPILNAKTISDNGISPNIDDSQSRKLQKYKTIIKRLCDENDAQKQEIDNCKLIQNKLKKKKSKLKDNLKSLSIALKESSEQIEQLQEINRKLEAQQVVLEQDNQNLNNQLAASVTFSNEKGKEYENLTNGNNQLKLSNDLIKKQLENQSDELKKFNQERQALLELQNKVNTLLLSYESTIESLKIENDSFKRKIKSSINDDQLSMLNKSEIPFDGELRAKCLKILMIEQYTPLHKFQLILNEANSSINHLAEQLSASYKEQDDIQEQLAQERKETQRYKEIIKSLLKELKNLTLVDDKINSYAFCEDDERFIDFVAEKASSIDSQIANEKESGLFFSSPASPSYGRTNESQVNIPINFFSMDDEEKFKEIILRELKPNDTVFSMFVSQFLLNVILKKQIRKLNDAQIKKADLDRVVQELNGVDIFELPQMLENLKKITDQNKEEVQQLQEELLTKSRSENELKIKVDQLQIQNDTLQNECSLLSVKNHVAANELLLNSTNTQSLSGIDENDVNLLKNELLKKKEENVALKQTIQNMQNELNQQHKRSSKELKKNENEYEQQIIELQQKLQEMNVINSNLKKKYKKMMKSYQKEMDSMQVECQQKIDESRQTFKEATDSIREKQKQSNELTQKLVQSLKESEESKQHCQSENSELILEKKKLQMQMTKLQEDIKNERQKLKGQLSALQMACDSRIQDVIRDMKQGTIEEKEKLYSILIDKLSSIYKIDCYQFNDDSYVELIERLKADLEKLQYLQSGEQFSV